MQVARPILCYVTDSSALEGGVAALPGVMAAALRAGVDWIQIREKHMPARQLVELARAALQDALAGADLQIGPPVQEADAGWSKDRPLQKPRILVNDRLDVALAAGAHGVHLGGGSLPVAEVRAWLRREGARLNVAEDFLVGRSCHSLEEAQQAERDGASYIIFGPVYATPSKARYGAPQGIERLAEVCGAVRIPVLAIGGITVENAGGCLRGGAAGIAGIRLFQQALDMADVVTRLRQAKPAEFC